MRSMCSADRPHIQYSGHRPSPFGKRTAPFLNKSTDATNKRTRYEPDCEKWVNQRGARGEDTVSARTSFFSNYPPVRQRPRERLERSELGFDDRGGDDFDAPTGSAGSVTEIESSVNSRQCGVKPFQRRPDLSANQHARLTNSQHIARAVVLRLVKFPFREVNRETGPRHRLADLANRGG
jgi:hypothetical protein